MSPTLNSPRLLPTAEGYTAHEYDSVYSDNTDINAEPNEYDTVYTDCTDLSEDFVTDYQEGRYNPYVSEISRHAAERLQDLPRPGTPTYQPTLASEEPSRKSFQSPPPGFKPRYPRQVPPPVPKGCEHCSRDMNADSRRKPRPIRRPSTTHLPENMPKLPPVAPRRPQKLQLKTSQPSDSETPCQPTTIGVTTAPDSARPTETPPVPKQLERLKSEAEALGLTDQMAIATYIVGGLRPQTSTAPSQPKVKGPPLRNDKWMKEESWELFIHRFERLARDLEWDESTKLLQLVSCLSGKSLEIYRRTDEEKECSYRDLKGELDLAFALTPEQVGKNFTGAYLEEDENCEQFTHNLEEKFKRWFRKANPDKPITADALINHCVREQLVKSLPVAIKQEILQEDMVDAHKIAKYATRYFQARKATGGMATPAPAIGDMATSAPVNAPIVSVKKKHWPKEQKKNQLKQPSKFSDASNQQKKRYHCNQCQSYDHWYYKCPNTHVAATAAAPVQVQVPPPQVSKKSTLHQSTAKKKEAGHQETKKKQTSHLQHPIKPTDPLTSAIGKVNDRKVHVLKDGGSVVNVVAKRLVKPYQYTSRKDTMVLLNGYRCSRPVAVITVDTPYCKGRIEACVVKNPPYDLIVGRPTYEASDRLTQQAKSVRPPKPLKISDVGEIVNDPRLSQLQQDDVTITHLYNQAISKQHRRRSQYKCVIEGGLLYRKKKKGTFRQLIVPEVYRNIVLKFGNSATSATLQSSKKTTRLISKLFFWPGMYDQIRRYVKKPCEELVQKKMPRRPSSKEMKKEKQSLLGTVKRVFKISCMSSRASQGKRTYPSRKEDATPVTPPLGVKPISTSSTVN